MAIRCRLSRVNVDTYFSYIINTLKKENLRTSTSIIPIKVNSFPLHHIVRYQSVVWSQSVVVDTNLLKITASENYEWMVNENISHHFILEKGKSCVIMMYDIELLMNIVSI